ncbi:MAG: hypothetical protein WBG48_01740 [Pricia sp.]
MTSTKVSTPKCTEERLFSHGTPSVQNGSRRDTTKKFFETYRHKIGNLLSTVKTESTILYWMAAVVFCVGIFCVLGMMLDHRTLMGVNVWVKPLKFAVSIVLYFLTVGYLITRYPYSNLKKNIINHATAWSLLLEFAIIAFQGARGVPSHYNVSTPFDGILFLLMGVFVGINVILMALFIFDTLRLKLNTTKPMQWAILLGWLTIFFGSWVGGQMIGQAAHNVGVADGGVGLPLVNWSTKGGDLRVAHFFAVHGLQIIPLFAVWASRKWSAGTRNQIIAVTVFALLFASWIGYIFYQAKQGIPLIAQ